MHERDSLVDRLMVTLHRMLSKPIFYSRTDELTYVNNYLCDFDRQCDPLALILYGDMIMFIGFPRQFMICCSLMFPHDVEDDGGWKLDFSPWRCFFVFTCSHYSLYDRDGVISWLTTLL